MLFDLDSFRSGLSWLTLAGRTAIAAGIISFAAHAWPRIKGTSRD